MTTLASTTRKLYILDTNVLMNDPSALFRFEEHDLFIPFVTLEELDKHKVGTQDANRNARSAIRTLASLMAADGLASAGLAEGFDLSVASGGAATGTLRFQSGHIPLLANLDNKPDNILLSVTRFLEEQNPDRHVAIVSKDINLRVKGIALGLNAEDYLNDHVVADADLLPQGFSRIELTAVELESSGEWTGKSHFTATSLTANGLSINEFVLSADDTCYRVIDLTDDGLPVLKRAVNYMSKRHSVWGLHALNQEQSMALNLLLDPEVDMVALLGPAGTGKTLLTLGAAMEQIFEERLFNEILYTRATVPLGDDIGYLPGTEEEKMGAWLGALEDAMEVLLESRVASVGTQVHKIPPKTELEEKLTTKSIAFMRGRTFNRKLVILDEAQNLTPKQMKALVTRVGPGSKLVLLGNLSQIDTPYLTELSSGLAYAVERFWGWRHFGHLILSQGERSRLATYANDNL